MPFAVQEAIILGTQKYSILFHGGQARAQGRAEDLIIRGEDGGKEMGFQSFTFTIIL